MKHFRKSGGFTLVELVVSIAVASLVTMAATTVLMLALRVNRQTSDTATKQYTVRTLLTAMENAAVDGSIKSLKTDHINYWELQNNEGAPIFSYSAFDKTISVNETVVLKEIDASNAVLDGNLLNIVLVTKNGTFDASFYCRTLELETKGDDTSEQPPQLEATVDNFIRVLVSQFGSGGKIIYSSTPDDKVPKYYSEWYIGTDIFVDPGNDWNETTPWCASYVSWALVEAGLAGPAGHDKWYSHVDEFMAYFETIHNSPNTGNLVFFNLDDDGEADHIGVVLHVRGGIVYTIEGNNNGRVAMGSYSIDDERILGYGTLTWPQN